MSVCSEQFEVRTKGKGTYEISDQVQDIVKRSAVAAGTVTVFVQHTSCSLVIMENAAPAARRDLEKFFERLVPEDADYEHDDEGPDDSTSHIRIGEGVAAPGARMPERRGRRPKDSLRIVRRIFHEAGGKGGRDLQDAIDA